MAAVLEMIGQIWLKSQKWRKQDLTLAEMCPYVFQIWK